MKIYKDENLEIYFDLDSKIVTTKFLRSHVILKEVAQFTGLFELIKPVSVLLDLSSVKSMEKFAKDLLIDDLPMYVGNSGISKFAIVSSSDEKLNEFIHGLFSQDKAFETLDLKDFGNAQDALVWLKS